MALQGTLDALALPDVLRLLATTAKTGRLHVEGDRGQGSVWLRDGRVTAGVADGAPEEATAEEVVFELLRFAKGSFAFQMNELSPNGEQPEDVELLLRKASALLNEWNELRSFVASLDHRVALVDNLEADEVTIDADRWPLLVTIARSRRSISDLARAMGLNELNVIRTVRDLVELGVVHIQPPRETPRPSIDRARSERSSRARDRGRSSTFGGLGSGETLATAPPGNGRYTTGEMQREGWLQPPERTSGSHRSIAPEAQAAALPSDSEASGPSSTSSLGATRPTSRLQSSDTTSGARRSRRSRPGASPDELGSGSARSASLGRRAPTSGGDAGPRSGPHRAVREGLGPPALPSAGSSTGKGDRPSRRPTASPLQPSSASRRRSRPEAPAPDARPQTDRRPLDSGPFGASSLPTNSGLLAAAPPSGLGSDDLRWARSVDAHSIPPNGPFGDAAVAPSGGPGNVAPHVAAMSPEARAAVQQTVGNGGGTVGPLGPEAADDLARRGRLINFLSSVRP